MQVSRVRSSSSVVPSYKRLQRGLTVGTPLHPTDETVLSQAGYSGSSSVISDNNNKEFAKIRRLGGVVLSDCLIERNTRNVSPGSISTSDGNYIYSGDIIEYAAFAIPSPSAQVSCLSADYLLIKAYAKMNSSSLMAGENWSDLDQTIGMLRHPFKSATKLLSSMIKSRNRKLGKTAASFAKATANTWLEYRYGWKPIILDMKTIVKSAQSKMSNNDKLRLVVRAGSGDSANGIIQQPATWNAAHTLGASATASVERTLQRDVGVVFDLINQTTSDQLAALFGTRLRDLPATAWEIVPYSFVADWFVGIGDWIQAITPAPGIFVRGNWVSEKSRLELNISANVAYPDPKPVAPSVFWGGYFGSTTTIVDTFSRTCNKPLPNTPAWKTWKVSSLHQADAASLLVKPIIGQLDGFRH